MRLSAKAQYACVAMLELACNHGDATPKSLKGISERHGIPHPFLVQILLQLKGGGLVESLRGAAGGYQLAKPPTDITLADIIAAIDQPTPQVSALNGLHSTPAVQTVSMLIGDMQQREQRLLEEVSLAELVKQTEPRESLTYQI